MFDAKIYIWHLQAFWISGTNIPWSFDDIYLTKGNVI